MVSSRNVVGAVGVNEAIVSLDVLFKPLNRRCHCCGWWNMLTTYQHLVSRLNSVAIRFSDGIQLLSP